MKKCTELFAYLREYGQLILTQVKSFEASVIGKRVVSNGF